MLDFYCSARTTQSPFWCFNREYVRIWRCELCAWEREGGGLLSLCSLISPDSSESAAKTLLSYALHLPLHHDHFLFTARPLTAYWCLLDSASFFSFSQILFFALVCCIVVHDDGFAPVVFFLITCCYCGKDKQGREERHNKPRQRYLMDQFVINLLPRAV